jgi:hypothetical protein
MAERELTEFGTAFGDRVSAALERAPVMVYPRHRVHACLGASGQRELAPAGTSDPSS